MSESFDISSAMEKLQYMMSNEDGQNKLKNIIDAFSENSKKEEDEEYCKDDKINEKTKENNNSNANFDFDSILKIKKLLTNSTPNNKHINLLSALKPYLKKTRQAKLETAIKIINLTQVAKIMKNQDIDKPD